jgi:hypothetical protein
VYFEDGLLLKSSTITKDEPEAYQLTKTKVQQQQQQQQQNTILDK